MPWYPEKHIAAARIKVADHLNNQLLPSVLNIDGESNSPNSPNSPALSHINMTLITLWYRVNTITRWSFDGDKII